MKPTIQVSTLRTKIPALIVLSAAMVLGSPSHVAGATIVQDSLERTLPNQSYGYLDGSSPAGYPTSIWSGGMYDYTTASGASIGSGQHLVLLNVPTLVTGHVYTLSVDIADAAPGAPNGSSQGQGGGGGAFLSFNNSTVAPAGDNFTSSTGPGMNYAGTYLNVYNMSASDADRIQSETITGNSSGNELKLVLDTTGSAWTVTSYFNGVVVPGFGGNPNTYTYTTNPTGLNSIDLSASFPNPIFSNLLLTDESMLATPEPATWAYLVSGLALLGVCLRRKRCQTQV